MSSPKTNVSIIAGIIGLIFLTVAVYLIYRTYQQIQTASKNNTNNSDLPFFALTFAVAGTLGLLISIGLSPVKKAWIIGFEILALLLAFSAIYSIYVTFQDLNTQNTRNAKQNALTGFVLSLVAGIAFLISIFLVIGYRSALPSEAEKPEKPGEKSKTSQIAAGIFGILGFLLLITAAYLLFFASQRISAQDPDAARTSVLTAFVLIIFGGIGVIISWLINAQANRYPAIFGSLTTLLLILAAAFAFLTFQDLNNNDNNARDHSLASFGLLIVALVGILITWGLLFAYRNSSAEKLEKEEKKEEEKEISAESAVSPAVPSSSSAESFDISSFAPESTESGSGFFNFIRV